MNKQFFYEFDLVLYFSDYIDFKINQDISHI